ncbi:hypothetical protein CSE16_13940 [Solibacillus sp. R5-41]|uniref:hypothetical protein n=1 Tax=Solibacillus sp. R5-41 TaxID=2048654 RepID=UPI000C129990|nr:hypothetical protein [Solibacillus sp. R5-41]ATP41063.1 hypothetical protein CSE16_13940 [Solibacillus sp. R5-41]
MDIASIIMLIGIVFIIISMFLRDKSNKVESDLEDLSINIYQETNALKRRIKMVEEELLVEPNFQVKSPNKLPAKQKDAMETFHQVAAQVKAAQAYTSQVRPPAPPAQIAKPINGILVSQVLALNGQGLSIEEISKRSTLTHAQIQLIIATGGRL